MCAELFPLCVRIFAKPESIDYLKLNFNFKGAIPVT
jgi:hypothetical protein